MTFPGEAAVLPWWSCWWSSRSSGSSSAMLLPAVNTAREAGRNAQCKNNLKQMGNGLPGPRRGPGIFPHGRLGLVLGGRPGPRLWQATTGRMDLQYPSPHRNECRARLGADSGSAVSSTARSSKRFSKWSALPCPSPIAPRGAGLRSSRPWEPRHRKQRGGVTAPPAYRWQEPTTRSMSAPCGDQPKRAGPATGRGHACRRRSTPGRDHGPDRYFGPRHRSRLNASTVTYTGISFEQSTIRKDDVTDGLSYTLLVGEKYLGPNGYGTGHGPGRQRKRVCRLWTTTSAARPVSRRCRIVGASMMWIAFGSAHPNAANFVLCDGSVITINYRSIRNFLDLASRRRPTVDMSKL